MAYSEILNEIQEQIDELTLSVTTHQETITASTAEVSRLQLQLEGLATLKANAQGLIDNQNSVDVNLNINVSGAGEGSSVIQHTGSTQV